MASSFFTYLVVLSLHLFFVRNSVSESFGIPALYITDKNFIGHLDEDKHVAGNILYACGHALRTTDGSRKYTVVGHIYEYGYVEGGSDDARFNHITGFVQTDNHTVIIVDHGNNCLRKFDRQAEKTEGFIGKCTKEPIVDRDADISSFWGPYSVMQDPQNRKLLYVTDTFHHMLKQIDMETKTVNLVEDGGLYRPRMISLSSEGRILVANEKYVSEYNPETKQLKHIVGVSSQVIPENGTFDDVKFAALHYVKEIDSNRLVVSDFLSKNVMLVDLANENVTALWTFDEQPNALMVLKNSLFIGFQGCLHECQIEKVPLLNNAGSTDELRPVCVSRNITKSLSRNEKKVRIEILPETFIELPQGEYEISVPGNCSVSISVVKGYREECYTKKIFYVADKDTNTAAFEMLSGGVRHIIHLSPGSHKYQNITDQQKCTYNVVVSDSRLRKQLEISLEYNISCKSVGYLNRALLTSRVKELEKKVGVLCGTLCEPPAAIDHNVLICVNESSFIMTWRMNKFYPGYVKSIPPQDIASLKLLLKNKRAEFNLVIPKNKPPFIEPVVDDGGVFAKYSLRSFCEDNYDLDEELCYRRTVEH